MSSGAIYLADELRFGDIGKARFVDATVMFIRHRTDREANILVLRVGSGAVYCRHGEATPGHICLARTPDFAWSDVD